MFVLVVLLIIATGVVLFLLWKTSKKGAPMPDASSIAQKERITFNTTDGVSIVGNFFAGAASDAPAVLLLHMMPAIKESWDGFAQNLYRAGYQVLAIDLRGHGESTKVKDLRLKIKELDYHTFSDAEHQASILDVEAAREWLIGRGAAAEQIFVGGASIGANLALQYLAEHADARAVFILSPGLDYRGIKTEQYMQKLLPGQRVFLATSEDDGYSALSVDTLKVMRPDRVTLRVLESGGHGTKMFDSHPELMEEIIMWLRN